LLAAAKRNHIAMAEFLLDRGASPEGRLGDAAAPSPERAFAPTSALHLCCELGYAQLARLLLARGANPNVANEEGYTPLMACVGQLDELLQELLASGANPNATVPGDGGANALHFAVMDGHIDALRVLLSSGADWRAPYGPARISPLALALNESDDECSAMLIASGADPLELMDLGNGDGARPIEDLAAERSMSLTEGLCRSAREKTILDAMRTPRWPPRERPRASSI
jgi:ankyrin